MKHQSTSFKVSHWQCSALAVALCLILGQSAQSFANEGDPLTSYELRPLDNELALKRFAMVGDFAARTASVMVSPSSKLYLTNRHLADSSTFPYRLLESLSKNPWAPAPFMPVPERDQSCYYGIPPYQVPQEYDVNTTPVNVVADQVAGDIDGAVIYEGDVVLTQGDKTLRSDKTTYDRQSGIMTSEGRSHYQGPEYTLISSDPVHSNLKEKVTALGQTDYQLNGSVARGSVDAIQIDHEAKTSQIQGLSFTTCPSGSESWHIEAKDVSLESGEAYGDAYNATLYLGEVPIFWTPYINFPISNKRKSGLLYPELSFGSSNGFDYAQPIYLNLAPNYDDTITPRIMTKRGLVLNNEFRYMPIKDSEGILTLEYVPNDTNWDLAGDDNQRWMIDWYHESYFFNRDLSFIIDYQKVRPGDYDYLSDLGSHGLEVTDDHLVQSFKAAYNRSTYDINLEVREYQSLVPDYATIVRPFSMMPQLKAAYYDTYGSFLTRVNGEVTHFSDPSDGDYHSFEATRLHIEPSVYYQFFNSRGTTLTAGATGFLTHYEQDALEDLPDYYRTDLGFTSLDSSVNRALYLLEVKGKTTLERRILDMRHTQTLEPEIAYRYIPYKNQDHIGLYDTTDRMTDYYSNFSYRRYTGIDRIADTNAVTFGITSRILDPHDRELLRLALSQTYSFVPSRVTLNPSDTASDYPRSPLSMVIDASPVKEITAHGAVTYNTEDSEISSWNFMTEYMAENGFLAQINYRYARDGNRSIENNVINLDQIGVQFEIPLFNDRFKLIAAAYRDLEQHNNIDRKLALRYEECCFAITFMIEDYYKTNWETLDRNSETRIGIQFEFKGLGAVNISGDKDVNSTDTYLLDHFNPTNLNQ